MTSRNPPSNDATTGTDTGNGTVLSDPDNSDTESLSSWGVIPVDCDFPSVIAAANSNHAGFPPTVEAEDEVVVEAEAEAEADLDATEMVDEQTSSYSDTNSNTAVGAEDDVVAEDDDEVLVEVEDADVEIEVDATEIVDEQTSVCGENNSSTDKTKHNNDSNKNNNNNNNNNTIIQPSSSKEGRERNPPNSTPPISENDCNSGDENNHTIIDTPKALVVAPLNVTNNDDTNDKDDIKDKNDNDDSIHEGGDEDSSIQAPPDVPVPFVVGLQTGTIIEELKNIFVGAGDNNNTNEDQLQQLQARQRIAVEYAKAEKLAAFADWGAYLRRYEDLQQVIAKDDHQKARHHYLEYGYKEGRDCGPGTAEKIAASADAGASDVADWGAYLRRYEDLQQVIDKNDYEKAKQHYLEYGFKEGRDCGPGTAEKIAANVADWGDYLRRYEDLQKAFGDDQEKARQHYLEYGYKEGRNPSPTSGFVVPPSQTSVDSLVATADWAAYLRRNTDVQQVCGTDQNKAKAHFLLYGFQEKRYAGPDLPLPPPPEARSVPAWSEFHTTR